MKQKWIAAVAAFAALLALLIPAAASGYDSPTLEQIPDILEGTDANGNPIRPAGDADKLVLTLYRNKEEMLQPYKVKNIEIAMDMLTRDAAAEALQEQLTPDMDVKKLTSVAFFYLHEWEDKGYVAVPVNLRISSTLRPGDFAEIVAFAPPAATTAFDEIQPRLVLLSTSDGSDHSDNQWVRIPSQLHADGSMTFRADFFGTYAIVTYNASADPTAPTAPSTPQSPQTGEQLPAAIRIAMGCGIMAALAVIVWVAGRKRSL